MKIQDLINKSDLNTSIPVNLNDYNPPNELKDNRFGLIKVYKSKNSGKQIFEKLKKCVNANDLKRDIYQAKERQKLNYDNMLVMIGYHIHNDENLRNSFSNQMTLGTEPELQSTSRMIFPLRMSVFYEFPNGDLEYIIREKITSNGEIDADSLINILFSCTQSLAFL